jgi:hypothetical protein
MVFLVDYDRLKACVFSRVALSANGGLECFHGVFSGSKIYRCVFRLAAVLHGKHNGGVKVGEIVGAASGGLRYPYPPFVGARGGHG